MANLVRPAAIAVVGLGYVGLSLATALARKYDVIGLDVDNERVRELSNGVDRNAMFAASDLCQPTLHYSTDPIVLKQADVIVIAVPTPVDDANEPDMTALRTASRTVGEHLRKGAIVVFESTVYPGCTEEECIPVIEAASGLKAHEDFGVGYSPERIDPGDAKHGLDTVVKVVSAGDPRTLDVVANMYGDIVSAGVHRAPSIRTAEAAKVIENIQRDLNISLMNELSMLFHVMDLDTKEVLAAAGTKWNFGRYHPGLVGGHCIPVDPYYLVHKARALGFDTQVILAGRRTNDQMASYVASQGVRLLTHTGVAPGSANALVLGLTFKEDVRDPRNAKALAVVSELEKAGVSVCTSDPLITPPPRLEERFIADPFDGRQTFDLVILAVPHTQYTAVPTPSFIGLLTDPKRGALMDLRGVLDAAAVRDAGAAYWTL